jgi:sensor histidine kinase YesM
MSISDSTQHTDLRSRVMQIMTRRSVYHALGWMALFALLLRYEDWSRGVGFALSNELVNLAFYMVLVYFNLYYLIPNYLTKQRFATYLALLILAALVLTPLRLIVFYFKFSQFPLLQQELVGNMGDFFLANILIGIGSTGARIVTDWFRQNREKQELANQTMQSELRFLKSQINPHFLFNTLNNLYALTLKKSDQAPEIVIKLSEMMRYMLYECNEKEVPLRKEINYLQNYLDLERLRQGRNVEISFRQEGDVSDQQIVPLLFIPFLENSFKHGLNAQITEGFVRIELKVDDRNVDFRIENSKSNALPLRPNANRPSGGIGLQNVRRRLELLYPKRHQFTISQTPESFAVRLQLQLD